ncbi:hypothetical protein GIB67_025993 [Kingdonia uniflora]|uniref:F-box domain-containing protein n=1 Tax=Kingdonia uniflora TaxID=39325 RepID=A0A7J7M2R1_9MAGN|nr:hypothetical protein GIB67_025993 [Kingdonia uniflora]
MRGWTMIKNMDSKDLSLTSSLAEGSIRRKITETDDMWSRLDSDIAETILARLPVADYFGFQFVSKRERSLILSPTFRTVSTQLFERRPWFLMLDADSSCDMVYDTEVEGWRHMKLPIPKDVVTGNSATPVGASGSLMCFKSDNDTATLCNLLTGLKREISGFTIDCNTEAVAMHTIETSYDVYIIFRQSSSLALKVFSSVKNTWTEILLEQTGKSRPTHHVMEWSAVNELMGVTSIGSSGQVMVHYISSRGRVVGCDTSTRIAFTYPDVPIRENCSLDLVECRDRILLVTLVCQFVTPRLVVWEFSHERNKWKRIASLPKVIAKDIPREVIDINCAGHDDYIMVCMKYLNYNFSPVIRYNISDDSWVKLATCSNDRNGTVKRFVSTYAFMPRIDINL